MSAAQRLCRVPRRCERRDDGNQDYPHIKEEIKEMLKSISIYLEGISVDGISSRKPVEILYTVLTLVSRP